MMMKVAALMTVAGAVTLASVYIRSEVDAQPYRKQAIERPRIEGVSSVGCPSAEEMNRNAAASGITEADIEALEQMNRQNGGIVAEPIIRERLLGGEIIYESHAAQSVTITDKGVISCSSFGTDVTADSVDEFTYIGGPLDNQGE